ncbi:C-GCAxxG-C-C family protein [Acidobacteriota bacterium]
MNKAAKVAYENYYVRGCMYGSFVGIVKKAAEDMGPPYSQFPFEMTHFGAGGGELWGSLCGTLNGGLAALGLFVGDTALRRTMANQLMTWYESKLQPQWKPVTPLKDVPKNLPKSKAFSPLCHVSVSRWVEKSGYEPFSPERADRCGRLSASVAEFVAIQLNEALIRGNLKSRKELSPTADLCTGCHGKGTTSNEPEILSRMDCTLCHDTETDKKVIPHL